MNRERRDANRRRPGDVDYDPRTLYLPLDFVKSLSGGQVIVENIIIVKMIFV